MTTTAEHTCHTCLFKGNCRSCRSWGCANYTPLDEDSDEMMDQYIEERRLEFYDEWNSYMSEDWD